MLDNQFDWLFIGFAKQWSGLLVQFCLPFPKAL